MFHLKEPPPKRMCENEIIAIMANHFIRDLVKEIRGDFFSIICDEYTGISNKEQLAICIRWVDKELEAHEDFLEFYKVPDIDAETIVSAIKDVLLKLQLSIVNCRGQRYDGASNMMGHKLVWRKESRTSNQRLILLTVMDTHSA